MKILLFWLELSACLCVFKNLLQAEASNSTLRRLVCSLLILLWSCYMLYSDLFHRATIIPNTLLIAAIILLLYTEKWYFVLCCFFVFSLILNILFNMSIFIYVIIAGIHSSIHLETYYFFDILAYTVTLLLSLFIGKKIPAQIKPLNKVHFKECFIITFVVLIDFFLSSISGLLYESNLNTWGRNLIIFAILIMIFISIILLFLYFRLQYYHTLLQQANTMNQQMLFLEEQHYKDLQKKNMDLRAFRHDYNYHITAMQGLVADNNLMGLKKYVETLTSIKEQVFYITTNHPVADAVINYFYENLPENTKFQIEGKFPENIFPSDSDLCIILSNLLRNAIEAVEHLETNEKKIFVSIYSNIEYMSILIENTSKHYDKENLEHLFTSKSDIVNHGFGLNNVREVINRYHGKLDLQYKNGVFAAYAYLRNIN